MKNYSPKFWLFFWTASIVFLGGWYLFCNTKAKGFPSTVGNVLSILPVDSSQKKDYQALATVGDFLMQKNDQEKTILILFQNNLEIRPGGGFVGAFGILKIKNGKIVSLQTHDLSNFDANIPDVLPAPYPLGEIFKIKSWKLRDSNFSPDFPTNAVKAEELYHFGSGQEKIDGVVAITANVLTSILKITGPISVDGYPGTYDSNNAILSLEYQVEKAFENQGIEREERKSVMSDLASEIEKRILAFSIVKKIELTKILLTDLDQKDIQLNFKNDDLQKAVAAADWDGALDQEWDKDFLMTVDANIGSFKSDYYVKRSIDYSVDLSKQVPQAKLLITYDHTATQADWMTRNYTDYLRVYVPEGAELVGQQNFDDVKTGNEFGKKYFGSIIEVSIGTSKTIELDYTLPESLRNNYSLKAQKQAGLNDVPLTFHLKRSDDSTKVFSKTNNGDTIFQ